MTLPRAEICEHRYVHQKNVHPGVVVIIKDGDAATHSFHDVALFQAPAREVKIDARGACDVGKGNGRRRCWTASGGASVTSAPGLRKRCSRSNVNGCADQKSACAE